MPSTTIKVDAVLRDRLRRAASQHGRTLGEQIAAMLTEQERQDRFARLAEQMNARPPDEDYHREVAEWQSDRWS
ncbi:MAG TPA: hypothetical protein VK095_14745 [Beutenbergiaceae bacterium]|nr:hypothetical protein [Beutenbergiaceae bacterium]